MRGNHFFASLMMLVCSVQLFGQEIQPKTANVPPSLKFTSDFRFRFEQDWHSRKSDGSYRDDRTRWRYRMRFGASFKPTDWSKIGFRVRTGQLGKQQDPHLTLGDQDAELATIPVGFDQIYFKVKSGTWSAGLGKFGYPFAQNNFLYWGSNVNPEGIYGRKDVELDKGWVDHVDLRAAYFVVRTYSTSLLEDGAMIGAQVNYGKDKVWSGYTAAYRFNNIELLPDNPTGQQLDYMLINQGINVQLHEHPLIRLEADYTVNLTDYAQVDFVDDALINATHGYNAGVVVGQLKQAGDMEFKAVWANVERFAAVDYLAQNAWARWDYSSSGSSDSRLTNFRGLELRAGYAVTSKFKVNARFFTIEQLVAMEGHKETGNRFRIDLDVAF